MSVTTIPQTPPLRCRFWEAFPEKEKDVEEALADKNSLPGFIIGWVIDDDDKSIDVGVVLVEIFDSGGEWINVLPSVRFGIPIEISSEDLYPSEPPIWMAYVKQMPKGAI